MKKDSDNARNQQHSSTKGKAGNPQVTQNPSNNGNVGDQPNAEHNKEDESNAQPDISINDQHKIEQKKQREKRN